MLRVGRPVVYPEPLVRDEDFALYVGDASELLTGFESETVDCCVTSPPYWGLRDYGHDDQIGSEDSPGEYVARLVAVFAEVRRILKPSGTLWVNLGDSYAAGGGYAPNAPSNIARASGQRAGAFHGERRDTSMARYSGGRSAPPGLKPKDLVGIPWRVAFALQQDGWYLRSDIIWSKPNPMPESVTDRPTKAHEYVFLLSKSSRYFFDQEAVRETATHEGRTVNLGPKSFSKGQAAGRGVAASGNGTANEYVVPAGRNVRSVWEIATESYPEAHFATFPTKLVQPCILAGCPEGGLVLDPFMGAGTTALVARRLGRKSVGIELNAKYAGLAAARLSQLSLLSGSDPCKVFVPRNFAGGGTL